MSSVSHHHRHQGPTAGTQAGGIVHRTPENVAKEPGVVRELLKPILATRSESQEPCLFFFLRLRKKDHDARDE